MTRGGLKRHPRAKSGSHTTGSAARHGRSDRNNDAARGRQERPPVELRPVREVGRAPAAPPGSTPCARPAIDRFDAVGFPHQQAGGVAVHQRRADRPHPVPARRPATAPATAATPTRPTNSASARRRRRTGLRQRALRLAALAAGQAAPRRPRRQPRRRASTPTADRSSRTWASYADVEANPFVALNTGFVRDGAFVHLAARRVVEQPIHLLFVSTAGRRADRLAPARAGGRRGQRRGDGRRELRRRRRPDGVRLSSPTPSPRSSPAPTAASTTASSSRRASTRSTSPRCRCELARDAQFVSHSASIGGRLTRNDLNVTMAGERADATLNGLVLIGGDQHVRQPHAARPRRRPTAPATSCTSTCWTASRTGVFKGKILVRQAAQKTDSKQTSKSLLLSDEATMNSQPALEIYADDVKCTHGSTTGPVDEEQVFYLRSRGVSLRGRPAPADLRLRRRRHPPDQGRARAPPARRVHGRPARPAAGPADHRPGRRTTRRR